MIMVTKVDWNNDTVTVYNTNTDSWSTVKMYDNGGSLYIDYDGEAINLDDVEFVL